MLTYMVGAELKGFGWRVHHLSISSWSGGLCGLLGGVSVGGINVSTVLPLHALVVANPPSKNYGKCHAYDGHVPIVSIAHVDH